MHIFNFFTFLSIDVHLGCFLILAVVDSAAMNMGLQMSFQVHIFISFRYITEVEFLNYMRFYF